MADNWTKTQRRTDYNTTFNSEGGKKVLEDIMAYCHVLEPLPTADPNQILVREGRRDVANMILSAMNFKPADYPELISEMSDGSQGA